LAGAGKVSGSTGVGGPSPMDVGALQAAAFFFNGNCRRCPVLFCADNCM
jgi:hypothetical protein